MQPFTLTDHLFNSLLIEPDGNGVVYVAIATDTEEAGRQVALDAEAIQLLVDRLTPLGVQAIRDQDRRQRSAERARQRQRESPRQPWRSRPQPAVSAQTRAGLADRSGFWCEIGLPGCTGRATDPCHRHGRGMGGRHRAGKARYDQLCLVVHGCRWCHDLATDSVGDDRKEYEARGLILRMGQDPETTPVVLREGIGRVWLSNDGRYLTEAPGTAVAS